MSVDTYFAQGGNAISSHFMGKSFVLKKTVDFSDYLANSGNGDFASGDIAKLFDIPAGTFIQSVIAKVTTAEGATLTVDIGDYTGASTAVDADGWIDGLNCNTTLPTVAITSSALGYFGGKYYSVDSWIGVLANNAADAAIIEISVIGFVVG